MSIKSKRKSIQKQSIKTIAHVKRSTKINATKGKHENVIPSIAPLEQALEPSDFKVDFNDNAVQKMLNEKLLNNYELYVIDAPIANTGFYNPLTHQWLNKNETVIIKRDAQIQKGDFVIFRSKDYRDAGKIRWGWYEGKINGTIIIRWGSGKEEMFFENPGYFDLLFKVWGKVSIERF